MSLNEHLAKLEASIRQEVSANVKRETLETVLAFLLAKSQVARATWDSDARQYRFTYKDAQQSSAPAPRKARKAPRQQSNRYVTTLDSGYRIGTALYQAILAAVPPHPATFTRESLAETTKVHPTTAGRVIGQLLKDGVIGEVGKEGLQSLFVRRRHQEPKTTPSEARATPEDVQRLAQHFKPQG